MNGIPPEILEAVIAGSAEPMLAARIDRPEWPVVLCNPAFQRLTGDGPVLERPLADVIEQLLGRELAVEVSETVRRGEESSIPVETAGREYLLVLKPVSPASEPEIRCFALFWRRGGATDVLPAERDAHQALLRAQRRIRDLSRDDPVTGLLNEAAFREVLAHDWAVAKREKSTLAIVCFSPDHFESYLEVFGRHATDACLRRLAHSVRRCLRRASDVAARIATADGEHIVVLSHASEEAGVQAFSERIAGAVRDLGLHHPRSRSSRFVMVSWRVALAQPDSKGTEADAFLDGVLQQFS